MRKAILVLVLATAAQAQTPPGFEQIAPRFAQLARYLDLNAQQITGLVRLEVEFGQFIATKQRRAMSVELEIREVTLAPVIDPTALGLRYGELESICRESKAKDEQTRADARTLMTPVQIAKLDALEQAYRMIPIIAEADTVHLINAPIPPTNLMTLVAQFPGCKYPAPGIVINPIPATPGTSQPGTGNSQP